MSRRSSLLSSTVLSGVSGVFLTTLTVNGAAAGSAYDFFDRAAFANTAPSLASGPAVDGVNGKIAGFGGSAGRKTIYGTEGSLQFPLGYQYGFQVDPRIGSVGGSRFAEIGAHLFWRNPGAGLLGLYVNHVHLNRFGGVDATAVGAEGEYYFGRWTLQGIAGVSFGGSASASTTGTSAVPSNGAILTTTTNFSEGFDIKTQFFDQINLKYYFLDNWAGYVGHRYLGGKHALAMGSEFVVPLSTALATTAFVEARVGQNDFDGVWGGMKFYFGHNGKSLIKRHRENDDPNNWSNLFTILNSTTGSTSTALSCSGGEVVVDGACTGGGES